MRLLMLGTGPFAVPAFQALLDSEHEIPALITRPVAKPSGRRKGAANPMRDFAVERGIRVLDPPDVNAPDAIEMLRQLQSELLIVCDFGQILSAEALSVASLGGINLHGSLLPEYRGAAPINWALLDGKAETGVTVIHMTPRLDAGPCLVRKAIPIGHDEDAVQLEERLSNLGVSAVVEAIEMLTDWDEESPIGVIQDQALATRAPRLKKQDGQIDWTKSAGQIRNHIRALKPWPGSYCDWQRSGGKSVRIILDRASVATGDEVMTGKAGQVVLVEKDRLLIATGDGALSIEQLKPAGKREMSIAEFLRGHPVQVGDRFDQPQ